MKLPNLELDIALNDLRRRMGNAALGDLTLVQSENILTEEELEKLAGIGIDVQWDQVRVLDDDTLAYKNRRVVLYIRDVGLHGNKALADVMPKFHVARCRTLDEMHANGRGQRYVVASRTSGDFAINVMRNGQLSEQRDLRLAVCQNCLDRLSFDDFSLRQDKATRESAVKKFSLGRFFAKYPLRILDGRGYESEDTAPLNEYPPDFADRARQLKVQRSYRCEECGWRPGGESTRRFVHLHHKNGQKFDGRSENLAVLCIGCHARQPLHEHLKQHPDFRHFEMLKGSA